MITAKYAGLKNSANNCWFNATIQALAHSSFAEWFLGKTLSVERGHPNFLKIRNVTNEPFQTFPVGKTGPVPENVVSLKELLRKLRKVQQGKILDPSATLVSIKYV